MAGELPDEITVYWCRSCKRTAMYDFMGHFSRHTGKRCIGTIKAVLYCRANK